MIVTFSKTVQETVDITFPVFIYFTEGPNFSFVKLDGAGQKTVVKSSYDHEYPSITLTCSNHSYRELDKLIVAMMDKMGSRFIHEQTFVKALQAAIRSIEFSAEGRAFLRMPVSQWISEDASLQKLSSGAQVDAPLLDAEARPAAADLYP